MKNLQRDQIYFLIGIFFSFLMVLAFPGLFFRLDLEVFLKWSKIWSLGWQDIYSNCPSCNYPILGMFSSAGLMNIINHQGQANVFSTYRLILSGIDAVNVCLVYFILKHLKINRPAYIAGIVGISISSWAGGALWGQIDSISQFFILLTIYWIIYKNTGAPVKKYQYFFFLACGAFLLAMTLLTKQLTIFSGLALMLFFIAEIWFDKNGNRSKWLYLVFFLFLFFISLLIFDPFLKLNSSYFSHLVYIWKEGTFQAGLISGNGFNIWILTGRDMWSSAYLPLIHSIPFSNPYFLGEVLFLLFSGLISFSLLLWLMNRWKNGKKLLDREVMLNFIFLMAIFNLGFNVFLTGTRDRYLFHFYPLIIIAWSGLSEISPLFTERMKSFLILSASLYGIFILQIITSINLGTGIVTHIIMALLHVSLYFSILITTLNYQNFPLLFQQIFQNPSKNIPTVR